MGIPLQALPKGRPLVVVSTKLVELASREVDRTIKKWEFGTPLDGDQKFVFGLAEGECNTRVVFAFLPFLSRPKRSKIELCG